MNFFTGIVLGVIQGLTEFLPVSSSAHLVIAQSFIPGFSQPGVLFDVILHAGTLCAVLFYFRKRILKLTLSEAKILIVGTIPAVVFGLIFGDWLESGFSNIRAVGAQLIVTGALCFLIDRVAGKKTDISITDGFVIGIAQAIAIIPGISRSGITILAGLSKGLNRKTAAEFSFFLSIPAILGAIVLQIYKYGFSDQIPVTFYAAGFVASLVFGFLSIGILMKLLTAKRFSIFGYYSVILGLVVILVR